jgi:hypothetical protein
MTAMNLFTQYDCPTGRNIFYKGPFGSAQSGGFSGVGISDTGRAFGKSGIGVQYIDTVGL